MKGKKFSIDEIHQISLRLKSARMLTGQTQEVFAGENNISVTSLKCWEMGRAVPRTDGLSNYLNAIREFGIEVTEEWILCGSGAGPTYIKGTQLKKLNDDEKSYLSRQIDLFKNEQLSKGLNPILVKIDDDLMSPYFKKGDLVGGYLLSLNSALSKNSDLDELKLPWLFRNNDNNFIARFLVLSEDNQQVFFRSNKTPFFSPYNYSSLGRICWHYRNI